MVDEVVRRAFPDRSLKLLALVIASHVNYRTGQCDPGQRRLAAETGFSEKQVARLTRQLEARGVLVVSRELGYTNGYEFHPESLPLIDTEVRTSRRPSSSGFDQGHPDVRPQDNNEAQSMAVVLAANVPTPGTLHDRHGTEMSSDHGHPGSPPNRKEPESSEPEGTGSTTSKAVVDRAGAISADFSLSDSEPSDELAIGDEEPGIAVENGADPDAENEKQTHRRWTLEDVISAVDWMTEQDRRATIRDRTAALRLLDAGCTPADLEACIEWLANGRSMPIEQIDVMTVQRHFPEWRDTAMVG